jgi:hypothetical protein
MEKVKMEKEKKIIELLKKEGKLNNVDILDKNAFLIKLKKNIYDKDLVFTASYFIIDEENIIFIDENNKEWLVYLFGKEKKIKEFFNFMVNYYFYRERAKENKNLKEELIKLSFFGLNLEDNIQK